MRTCKGACGKSLSESNFRKVGKHLYTKCKKCHKRKPLLPKTSADRLKVLRERFDVYWRSPQWLGRE